MGRIPITESFHGNVQGDPGDTVLRQTNPDETAEGQFWLRQGGVDVPEVNLRDLVAVAHAGVFQIEGQSQRVALGDFIGIEPGGAVLEARVTQAMTKSEQRLATEITVRAI